MGKTPVELAASEGLALTVRLLLSLGADPDKEESVLGFSPLHTAASKGFREVAEALIEGGADVGKKNAQVLNFVRFISFDLCGKCVFLGPHTVGRGDIRRQDGGGQAAHKKVGRGGGELKIAIGNGIFRLF